MTVFNIFTIKIETSWAKKFVKLILETWNAANDAIVYVWFILLCLVYSLVCWFIKF